MLVPGRKYMKNLNRELWLFWKGYMGSAMKTSHFQTILQVELECRNRSETWLWDTVWNSKMRTMKPIILTGTGVLIHRQPLLVLKLKIALAMCKYQRQLRSMHTRIDKLEIIISEIYSKPIGKGITDSQRLLPSVLFVSALSYLPEPSPAKYFHHCSA